MDSRQKISFIAAVASLTFIYLVSGAPISLYSVWQEELGMTHAQLSLVSMLYLSGTVFPLLILPRISDHIGRRPATTLAILMAIAGTMTFAMVSSPEMVMFARLMQGLVSGMASSTVAAFVVDTSEGFPRWIGPMITSSAPSYGICIGAVSSGAVVSYTDVPISTIFVVLSLILVVCMVLVFMARETMPRKPGLVGSMKPRICIPKGCGRLFIASSMIFMGTWAVEGFSQSFSSTLVLEHTGSSDPFVAALLFITLLLPNAFGALFANRFDVRAAQRYGTGIYTVCLIMLYVSLAKFDSLLLFAIFSITVAFMEGVVFTSCVTAIITRATKEERAGTFSMIYAVAYGGSSIPSLVVGLIPGEYSVATILSWYVVLLIVMYVVLLILSAKPYDEAGSPLPE